MQCPETGEPCSLYSCNYDPRWPQARCRLLAQKIMAQEDARDVADKHRDALKDAAP